MLKLMIMIQTIEMMAITMTMTMVKMMRMIIATEMKRKVVMVIRQMTTLVVFAMIM